MRNGMPGQIRLAFIITGLGTGGAELMLYKLLGKLDPRRFKATVISLTEVGPVGEKIRALRIPVHALGMARGIPNPLAVLRLAMWLHCLRPHLVHTWMYHADLVGGIAAKL